MASHGRMHDDYVGVSPMHDDNALELFPFDYNGTDNSIHFPFLGSQTSPSPAENVCGYQQNFPHWGVHDLDMVTNVHERNRYSLNNSVGQDVVMRNNSPMIDNQFPSFPSVAAGTVSSGFQTSNNNMMSAYQGVSRVPHFENSHDSAITNSIRSNSSGSGNLQMSALYSGAQNRAEIGRTFTNFSSEPKFEQTILPRVYSNQDRVHSTQPSCQDKLDGRFLSLGYQGEVASNANSHGGQASHHIGDSSFFSMFDSSHNNVRGGLATFENNVGGSVTPFDWVGNQTLSGDDYYCLQAMSSGSDTRPIVNVDESQVNMHRYIPTPSTVSLESGIKPKTIIDLTDDSSECTGGNSYMFPNVSRYDNGSLWSKKRRMQGSPFNSSVLRSNHQIAAEAQQKSHSSTNLLLPPLRTNIGESDSQDMSGLAHGIVTASSGVQTTFEGGHLKRSNRLLLAGQSFPSFPVRRWPSTGQGAETANNERLCASSVDKNESLKRTINSPPRATTQIQRRKLKPQTSVQQFSPDLVQNALGQIDIGHSVPVITSTVKEFNIPSAPNDFAASGWHRNTTSWHSAEGNTGTANAAKFPQHPIASTAAFVPPIHISPSCTTSGDSPASLADSFTIPVVTVESAPRVSLPVNAPPTALARTITSRSGSSRIPIPASSTKKVTAANIPTAAYGLSSAIASRRSNLLHAASTMNRPVHTDWKKSLPTMAGLAKIDPALRASQVLGSMSHIKWQGFDIPPTVGFKCMICNRDLSFTPEGPVVQPPIPPAVAVLPCGHTFHDHCLLRITPEDQSKDPPCIPCVVDN